MKNKNGMKKIGFPSLGLVEKLIKDQSYEFGPAVKISVHYYRKEPIFVRTEKIKDFQELRKSFYMNFPVGKDGYNIKENTLFIYINRA